ncbi:MAG: hypothetical protein HZB59_03870 [Ignavibacteriales bacterium]|nr:hypothetical protein [Ignavibacteriales bacterium]
MTLSCNKPFSKTTYGPGIYINEVTIVNASDISGEQLPLSEQPIDIGIKLTLDIGKEFQPQMIIAGNFKRDFDSGEVVGWGSGFLVQEALARFGYNGTLDEANHIPTDIIDSLAGKKFLRLSYISGVREGGKYRYTDWNQIASVEEGADFLLSRFKRSLAKGYPRNYHPDLLDMPAPVTEQMESMAF